MEFWEQIFVILLLFFILLTTIVHRYFEDRQFARLNEQHINKDKTIQSMASSISEHGLCATKSASHLSSSHADITHKLLDNSDIRSRLPETPSNQPRTCDQLKLRDDISRNKPSNPEDSNEEFYDAEETPESGDNTKKLENKNKDPDAKNENESTESASNVQPQAAANSESHTKNTKATPKNSATDMRSSQSLTRAVETSPVQKELLVEKANSGVDKTKQYTSAGHSEDINHERKPHVGQRTSVNEKLSVARNLQQNSDNTNIKSTQDDDHTHDVLPGSTETTEFHSLESQQNTPDLSLHDWSVSDAAVNEPEHSDSISNKPNAEYIRQEPEGECLEIYVEERPRFYCGNAEELTQPKVRNSGCEPAYENNTDHSPGTYVHQEQKERSDSNDDQITEGSVVNNTLEPIRVLPRRVLESCPETSEKQSEARGTKPKSKSRKILKRLTLPRLENDSSSRDVSSESSEDSKSPGDTNTDPQLFKPSPSDIIVSTVHESTTRDQTTFENNSSISVTSAETELQTNLKSATGVKALSEDDVKANKICDSNKHNRKRSKAKSAYSVDRENPGMVLIINNTRFRNPNEERKGAEKDAAMLQDMFSKKRWDPIIYKQDLDANEIKEAIQNLTTKIHKSCVAVFILSHGGLGDDCYVYGSDRNKVSICLDVFRPLDELRCSNLQGIPKLFFIQACQDETIPCCRDGLPEVPSEITIDECTTAIETDGGNKETTWIHLQPKKSDNMLVVYSCRPTEVSLREQDKGSIFIQELVQQFAKEEPVDVEEGCLRVKHSVTQIAQHYGYIQVPSVLPLLDKRLAI